MRTVTTTWTIVEERHLAEGEDPQLPPIDPDLLLAAFDEGTTTVAVAVTQQPSPNGAGQK